MGGDAFKTPEGMCRASRLSAREHDEIYAIVEEICSERGVACAVPWFVYMFVCARAHASICLYP